MAEGICEEVLFQSIYFKHSEYLRNFMYYKTGDMGLSEDLAQDAFSKMWENCAKVPAAKAKSYVFTVANNLFLNVMNHKKVVLKFEQQLQKEKDIQDPQFLLEEKEFKAKLEMAISELPEEQRVVFLMNRVDKKKYRQIAEELGVSVKAIEKRMHKALMQLRKIHKRV